jgi:hypothetical protein
MPTRRPELRKSARRPLRRAAWLTVSGQTRPVPCVLWDISHGGARLAAAKHNELPDVFTLVLPKTGVEHRCAIVWRNQRFVGVKFLQ